MNKQVLTLITVLSMLLVAGSAVAQTIHVRGDVPFNFIIGKQAFDAGQYDISSMANGDGKTLLIRSLDGGKTVFVHANSAECLQKSDGTKLIFNRYGDRYFLAQVWVEGAMLGHQFPKGSREAEMATNYASNTVVVLAQMR